jgi:adenine deaminase
MDHYLDKIVINGKLVNVFTGEIYVTQVGIINGEISTVDDDLAFATGENTEVIDAAGLYLTPGLIDTHLHLHHTLLDLVEFSKAAVKRGVTAVGMDLYGEGIVRGVEPIRKILDASKKLPIRLLFLLPFPAYIQNRPFNHNGYITLEDLYTMMDWEECLGMMDTFATEVLTKPKILKLCRELQKKGKFVSGHGSELTNQQINEWVKVLKKTDDHEAIDVQEMLYKLRHGLKISMRFATGTENLSDLCTLFIKNENIDKKRIAINSDVITALDLHENGYIDEAIRIILKSGVSTVEAYQMATINAAEMLQVDSDLGSISPGRKADILFIENLEEVTINAVMFEGSIIYKDGKYMADFGRMDYPDDYLNTVILPDTFNKEQLKITYAEDKIVKVRVIKVNPHNVITEEIIGNLKVNNGIIECNSEKDILYISAIERIKGTGKISNGFISGFNIKEGALGLTYNSQGENLLVMGTNHDDMYLVVKELERIGGGCIAAANGKILCVLELKLFGLESIKELETVVQESKKLSSTVKEMGCTLHSPFETLSFAGLPNGIGNLKICPEGIVDVWKEKIVDLVLA